MENKEKSQASWVEPILIGISIAFAVLLIAMQHAPYDGLIDRFGRYFGNDFINFWFGAYLAGKGQVGLLADLPGYTSELYEHFSGISCCDNYFWSYPPIALLMFWPLAQLPYLVAFTVFMVGGMTAMLAAGLRITRTDAPVRMLMLSALAPASLFNIICGQNGFLSGALLLGGFLCLQAKPVRAGLWYAFLAFKPQLALLLPVALIGLRSWKAIVATGLFLAVLIAASLLIYGVQPWQDFLTVTRDNQMRLLIKNHGYYAEMLASPYAAFRALGVEHIAAMVLQALVSAGCVAAVGYSFYRPGALPWKLLVLCAAMPLVVPYSMIYDLPALSLLLAARLCMADRWSWRKMAYACCWLSPALFWIPGWHSNGLVQFYLSVTLIAACTDAQYRVKGAVAGTRADVAGTR